MLRPILRYGDQGLHVPAQPVASITADTQTLIDDMIETLYAAPGVGLRLFVIDLSVGRATGDLIVMINPEFVERDGMQLEEEGCLSVPGFNATVVRPARVVCAGLDRDGTPQRVEGTELLARAFQHEMDHLEGTLFVDRLRGIKRDMIVRRIQKLKRAGRW
ncbi:MAG: peptide deformylase [Acidobacteria bacterium]|nr:peptide deformylase [Acidobacteriota bacterium]